MMSASAPNGEIFSDCLNAPVNVKPCHRKPPSQMRRDSKRLANLKLKKKTEVETLTDVEEIEKELNQMKNQDNFIYLKNNLFIFDIF